MKKVLFLACLMAGMLCACSSDDDSVYVPDQKDFVESVSDTIGYVWYDDVEKSWCIYIELPSLPEGQSYIDSAIYYYTDALPKEYQQIGIGVKVSGDIYEYHFRNKNHVILGGSQYYYIDLKKIEPKDWWFCATPSISRHD